MNTENNIQDATAQTIATATEQLKAKGYHPMTSGLPAGEYSGTVDNIEQFISIRTYDKASGNAKGGIMYAIRATIQIDGGEAFKVVGFDVTSGKRLLLALDQVKLLKPADSFKFTVSAKGYATGLNIVSNVTSAEIGQLTKASINAMDKDSLIQLATKESIDISGITAKSKIAEKLIGELI